MINTIFENVTGVKAQNLARQYRHFFSTLWVAAHTLPFLSDAEAAE